MQEKLNEVKVLIVAGFGALTSFLGVLAIPVYVLVASNIIDYFTALFATEKRGQNISSSIGIKGIVKKVCMWLLIVVGVLLDKLLIYLGISLPLTFPIACIVALWLCANEIISILENISDILGDDMPSFLLPIVKNIRRQVEDKIDIKEEN